MGRKWGVQTPTFASHVESSGLIRNTLGGGEASPLTYGFFVGNFDTEELLQKFLREEKGIGM